MLKEKKFKDWQWKYGESSDFSILQSTAERLSLKSGIYILKLCPAAKGTRGLSVKRLHETYVKSKYFREDYIYPIDFLLSSCFLSWMYDTRLYEIIRNF